MLSAGVMSQWNWMGRIISALLLFYIPAGRHSRILLVPETLVPSGLMFLPARIESPLCLQGYQIYAELLLPDQREPQFGSPYIGTEFLVWTSLRQSRRIDYLLLDVAVLTCG